MRTSAGTRDTTFLIESNFVPVGMAGVSWSEPELPELGFWIGVEQGDVDDARAPVQRDKLPDLAGACHVDREPLIA